MAAGLSIVGKIVEMFSGRDIKPWHGLGRVVMGLLSAKEAIEAAHLDWEVEKRDTYWLQGGNIQCVPNSFALVRTDTESLLGTVGRRYQVFQNRDAFEFFDAIVGEGRAVYDTAGALFGGKKIWISAKLNPEDFGQSPLGKSDPFERYVLLTNTFTGMETITMRAVTTRVVCANTMAMAMRENASTIRIPHMGQMEERIDAAREAMGIITEGMRELETCLAELRGIKMSKPAVGTFAYDLTDSDREAEAIVHLFSKGIGCEGKTRYDAFNAVTQLTTHHLPTRGNEQLRNERRMDSVISGRGHQMQKRALSMLVA